ncbi:MAG: polysaccharide deacetylase [Acidobacteria bacterium]|nr:MAG: polysaccharide deacetylase [Acidobacteriota bacterium]
MSVRKHSVLLTLMTLVGAQAIAYQYEVRKEAPATKQAFRWPEGKRGALSLSFDDARPSQVDNGVPLLNRYTVRATFFVSPDRLKDRADAWKRAISSGHEIGNHSLTHPCTGNFPFARHKALEEYTLDKMRTELTQANTTIRELLAVTPTSFAYPCGQSFVGRGMEVKSYVPLVAQLFKTGRGWLGEGPNDPGFCDMAQLLGVPSDDLEFGAIKPQIDQAMQNGYWLVLAGHDIAESGPRQVTRMKTLEAICQYASDPANGIWIDTIGAVGSYVAKQRGK